MPTDDDLANTATAAAGEQPKRSAALGATLGRYRLERVLGEGGMGVVHAAFDPDLERRVALKVLRNEEKAGSSEARQRLLREARAMARLAHANVVTVHEVGNAGGRDFVAMELIDGDNLADWLRGEKRPEGEILAAFLAAGRGLAAAHAAGLVHRDFKPHNVLRGRDGRIVVTDFGLARGVDTTPVSALEQTMDLRAGAATQQNTPSSLSGLTMTGSVLGTPAYMAPEQWNASTIGPPADQFAFCVALWEALVGERPYRGDTIEQLKAAVERGPAALDDSRLPRKLRAAVRRGLDPDPARRWPTMDVLLARLATTPRTVLALALGGGAVAAAVAVAIIAVATRGSSDGNLAAAPPPCAPPAIDPAVAWPAGAIPHVAADSDLAKLVSGDLAAWRTARATACAAHDTARVACLDGVVARIDAIHRALEHLTSEPSEMTAQLLVAPSACAIARPPRLPLAPTPDTIAALALYAGSHPGTTAADEAPAATFAARPGLDPCARAIAQLAFDQITTDVPRGKAATLDAITAAESCGDDRLIADAQLAEYPYEAEQPAIGPRGIAALKKAKSAVDRAPQPDLLARIDMSRAKYAAQQAHWDEAFAAGEAAADEFAARGRRRHVIRAIDELNALHFRRNAAGDLQAARDAVAKWRPAAVALHDDKLVEGFDQTDAYARLFLGDVSAHAEIMRTYHPAPSPSAVPGTTIDGVVVDERGQPVAGATVAIGTALFVDSVGPIPLNPVFNDLRIATADAQGKYTIANAPPQVMIAAQSDPRHRSDGARAEAHMRLVLHPTRRIAGKVALAGTPPARSFAVASASNSKEPGRYVVMSPLGADGSYALEGVTTAEVKVGVATAGTADAPTIEFVNVPAGTADLPAFALATPNTARTLDVIVRSASASPFESAQVFTLSGKHAFKISGELSANHHLLGMQVRWAQPIVGEAIPTSARGLTLTGDLVAQFTDVRAGDITVCAVGYNVDLGDPVAARKLNEHREELAMACVLPAPGATAVVVEAPAQKRYD